MAITNYEDFFSLRLSWKISFFISWVCFTLIVHHKLMSPVLIYVLDIFSWLKSRFSLKRTWSQINNFCLKRSFLIKKQNDFSQNFQKFLKVMASLTLRHNLIIQNFPASDVHEQWSERQQNCVKFSFYIKFTKTCKSN